MSQRIVVDVASQTLHLLEQGRIVARYAVSTAANGLGEREGSLCTPRGQHRIRARIGAGQPLRAVFRGRRPTGEICDAALYAAQPERDWILSRILWLGGCQPGVNRYGDVDTQRRYIYIHGTAEEERLGQPASHGCVRMGNQAVIELFDRVDVGCPVLIDG